MMISVCTLTYNRNLLLTEAVESFLRQTFADAEMLVFNTLEHQQLVVKHPRVRVINHKPRPRSLGETRNLCIEQCRGEFIVNLDDDDIMLSGYLSWLAEHIGQDGWVKQAARFNMGRRTINSVTEQACNQLMFRKSAWALVGGYPHMDSGEDRVFNDKLCAAVSGRKVELPREDIGFIYSWDDGCYHMSGGGENKPGHATAWERARKNVQKAGSRRGTIQIVPRWGKDYAEMAREFVKYNK